MGFGSSGGEDCILEIVDLAFKGLGVGKASGKVYFVPFAVPGDRVIVGIQKDFGSYGFGMPLKFLRLSDDRINPPCPQFERCGGCQLQHLPYEIQISWKKKWITDHLRRIGGIAETDVRDVVASPLQFEYRNKASVHIAEHEMGFLERSSSRVIDVPRCLLLDSLVHEGYDAVRIWNARRSRAGGIRRVLIRSGENQQGIVVVHDPGVTDGELAELRTMLPHFIVDRGGSRRTVRHLIRDADFEVDAEAFFQVNGSFHESMTELIADRVGSGELLIDAHAGVGWPSLCLSHAFRRIEAMDISRRSISLANKNSIKSDIHNTIFHRGTLHSLVSGGRIRTSPDCLLCDPPRRGIDVKDMKAIQRLHPRRIVYISCDPATLARDAGKLVRHGYKMNSIIPMDLFPQTFHIETIALFTTGAEK